jgi:aldehyde:ferredoxin oxidoreductase
LGPDNKLIFAPGLLTGQALPGSGRNSAGAISPLTGAFGEAEGGGFFGAELKRAGLDAVIIEGAAKSPTYLYIEDGRTEIREAEHLWGLETADAEEALKGELGSSRVRTAIIGPGGENLVRYASIANDIRHTLGRTGLGAVMGSKRLKAVAVKGSKAPVPADKKGITALAKWLGQNYPEKANATSCIGTGAGMAGYEATGNLPIRNFQGGFFPEVNQISPHYQFDHGYVIKRASCFACPIRCKRIVGLDGPLAVDSRYSGPEYETLAALGSNCGVTDAEALLKAGELCERYGIDTISTGVSISFAMECYERQIINKDDTNGLELNFGNADSMLEMVQRIALRQGLGDLLAEGTKRAAQKIGRGSSEYAMQVKGLEIPMHEPRYKQGLGLHYSVHATGADHCCGIQDDLVVKALAKWESINLSEEMPSQELSTRKVRMLYEVGLWRHLSNYLGMCILMPYSYQQLCDAVEAVTGWPTSYWKLMKAAERGVTLARTLNLKLGFTDKDDTLPNRFFSSAAEGPLKDTWVDPGQLENARKLYYQMLGWNEKGIPSFARLVELDIEWAKEHIENIAVTS